LRRYFVVFLMAFLTFLLPISSSFASITYVDLKKHNYVPYYKHYVGVTNDTNAPAYVKFYYYDGFVFVKESAIIDPQQTVYFKFHKHTTWGKYLRVNWSHHLHKVFSGGIWTVSQLSS